MLGPIGSQWLKLDPHCPIKILFKECIFGVYDSCAIFSEVTEKKCVEDGHPAFTAKIRFVQDCAAMSAIVGFLLYLTVFTCKWFAAGKLSSKQNVMMIE